LQSAINLQFFGKNSGNWLFSGMLNSVNLQLDFSADDWAIRSEFWAAERAKSIRPIRRRQRNSNPLILCGHGMSLRVEQGTLIVRDGFSHYPQERITHRFFPGSRDIPERILLLDGSGTLSFEVLNWLAEQDVALARVRWTGDVACVASGNGFASDPAKIQWQHFMREAGAERLRFAAQLVSAKLAGCADVLERFIPASDRRDTTVERHRLGCQRLVADSFNDINDIRAIEGQCASMYFTAWQGLELRWKGAKAIPPQWLTYDCRSSLANGIKAYNREASHPINAMLNYAYAVHQAHMQIQAIAEGYDPTVGIMHHARRGKPAFIFDLIEPERPKIDAAILGFVSEHTFAASDFILRKDGVCRLSPQLARAVAAVVSLATPEISTYL
jgi:CRISPR-associated endonuclease Cas1